MTDFNEQFKVFETKLRTSVEEYVKSGGKLISGNFRSCDGKCKCPLACLTDSLQKDVYEDAFMNLCGLSFGEANKAMWAFVNGFDGQNSACDRGYPIFFNLGVQLRKEYLSKNTE